VPLPDDVPESVDGNADVIADKRAKSLLDYIVPAAVVLLFVVAFFSASSKPIHALIDKPAPAFKLPARSGELVALADARGKVVVLDFWASWCEPCLRQMPKLAEVGEIVGPDVVILSVNVDEATEDRDGKIAAFLTTAKVDFDVLVDNGTAADLYHVDSLPALVIVDRDGVVRYADAGVHDTDLLVRKIEELRGGADG